MLILDGGSLTARDLVQVAKGVINRVEISRDALERICRAQAVIQGCLRDARPVYGVNTGFGSLCNTPIKPELLDSLQQNLVRSHASGTGDTFSQEVVRGAMLLRANNFCGGHSGVRPLVVQTLISMLNRGVVPAVRSCGSLGASGDLAPLADLALVLIGEGKAWFEGKVMEGNQAMAKANITPLRLEAKEGLALLNGTAFMTSIAALACDKAMVCLEALNAAAALSLLAFDGTAAPFSDGLVEARPHSGARLVAFHMRRLLSGSLAADGNQKQRVQDPYSFRCVPQVHGAALTALIHANDVLGVELNSATDNPLVIDGDVISGGNFHGQPVGTVMDYLTLAVTSLAAISERRINQLVDERLSGLPAFLIPDPGVNSGFMIAQYTAASLVNECRVLATPASVQSVPVSAEQEDHVSMATFAAHKCLQVMERVVAVSAIELLMAAQALDLRLKGRKTVRYMGETLHSLHNAVRNKVPFVSSDEPLSGHIDELIKFIHEEELRSLLQIGQSNLACEV